MTIYGQRYPEDEEEERDEEGLELEDYGVSVQRNTSFNVEAVRDYKVMG